MGGRPISFTLIFEQGDSSRDEDKNSHDLPDGTFLSRHRPDEKDGPMEHAEDDKERELELAQEALDEVIAAFNLDGTILGREDQKYKKDEGIDDNNDVEQQLQLSDENPPENDLFSPDTEKINATIQKDSVCLSKNDELEKAGKIDSGIQIEVTHITDNYDDTLTSIEDNININMDNNTETSTNDVEGCQEIGT